MSPALFDRLSLLVSTIREGNLITAESTRSLTGTNHNRPSPGQTISPRGELVAKRPPDPLGAQTARRANRDSGSGGSCAENGVEPRGQLPERRPPPVDQLHVADTRQRHVAGGVPRGDGRLGVVLAQRR